MYNERKRGRFISAFNSNEMQSEMEEDTQELLFSSTFKFLIEIAIEEIQRGD